MQRAWNPQTRRFHCYYTDVVLLEKSGRARSMTWEHLRPGKVSKMALACALINDMKTDLSEPQFRKLVAALAVHFNPPFQPFKATVFPRRWRRGNQSPTVLG